MSVSEPGFRSRHRLITVAAMAAALACSSVAGLAATVSDYPSKPIRLIVASAAGGGITIMARSLAQKLVESFGQPVVVDNRGGAGGNIAMEIVAKSARDGYTLLFVTTQLAINPGLYANLAYDPVKDFAPVTLLARSPYLLVVHPAMPAKSVKELVALARARPGQLTYASAGNGSGGHLCGATLNALAGINILHVPYKGSGPALTDVLAGNVQMSYFVWSSSGPHVQAGKLRALGVTTARRLPAVPDVPAIAETFPGYDLSVWYGVLAPGGTPGDIVAKLNDASRRALAAPDFSQRLDAQGVEIIGNTPQQFGDYLRSEVVKWTKVVKDSGAKID